MRWVKHRCPVCSRRTAVVRGRLARHKHEREWCKGGGLSTFDATLVLALVLASKGAPLFSRSPAPRSTIRTMRGQTGDARCRTLDEADAVACAVAMATCGPDSIAYFEADTKCTAPTPGDDLP